MSKAYPSSLTQAQFDLLNDLLRAPKPGGRPRTVALQAVKRVKKMDQAVSRLHTIWVDGGFDGAPFLQWVRDVCRWLVQVVLRPEPTKGFVLLKKRWVVEMTQPHYPHQPQLCQGMPLKL